MFSYTFAFLLHSCFHVDAAPTETEQHAKISRQGEAEPAEGIVQVISFGVSTA